MGSCCYILGNLEEFMAMSRLFCYFFLDFEASTTTFVILCQLFHLLWWLYISSGSLVVVSVLKLNLLLHGDFILLVPLSVFFFLFSLLFFFSWMIMRQFLSSYPKNLSLSFLFLSFFSFLFVLVCMFNRQLFHFFLQFFFPYIQILGGFYLPFLHNNAAKG